VLGGGANLDDGGGGIREVGADRPGVTTGGGDLQRKPLRTLAAAPIAECDARSLRRQSTRQRLPDAPARPGDERGPVAERTARQ
jgi:hypothetical protein